MVKYDTVAHTVAGKLSSLQSIKWVIVLGDDNGGNDYDVLFIVIVVFVVCCAYIVAYNVSWLKNKNLLADLRRQRKQCMTKLLAIA